MFSRGASHTGTAPFALLLLGGGAAAQTAVQRASVSAQPGDHIAVQLQDGDGAAAQLPGQERGDRAAEGPTCCCGEQGVRTSASSNPHSAVPSPSAVVSD